MLFITAKSRQLRSSTLGLEHSVVVFFGLRNDLKYIPVLHDLSVVVESKDVDTSVILIAWPLLIAVEHNIVSLSDGSLEVHSLARVFRVHSLKVLDEGFLAVTDLGIVVQKPGNAPLAPEVVPIMRDILKQ